MALIKEIHFTEGPFKGGTVRIFDDAYRGASPEEIARRRREAGVVALGIWNRRWAEHPELIEQEAERT